MNLWAERANVAPYTWLKLVPDHWQEPERSGRQHDAVRCLVCLPDPMWALLSLPARAHTRTGKWNKLLPCLPRLPLSNDCCHQSCHLGKEVVDLFLYVRNASSPLYEGQCAKPPIRTLSRSKFQQTFVDCLLGVRGYDKHWEMSKQQWKSPGPHSIYNLGVKK